MEPQVMRKMKAAVKAKLIDLEAYVDDELPDYIMVMVSNDKTQAQMASDLALFLGDDANKFASWLHRAMTKLKAMTAEKQKNKGKDESTSKNGSPTSKDAGGGKATGASSKNAAPSGPASRESTPPTQQKKIAISFKKSIAIKSKLTGTGTPLETSPAASPRRLEPLHADSDATIVGAASSLAAAASPVSSASLDQSPRRGPSPEGDDGAGDKKDDGVGNNSSKRKSKDSTSPQEAKKRREDPSKSEKKKHSKEKRQREVEEKEQHIVAIMEQIKRLKERLVEEEEGSGSDDEEQQQQLGDIVRAKIASLRQRLESIQEEIAEEEEEDEEDDEEGKVEEKGREKDKTSVKPTMDENRNNDVSNMAKTPITDARNLAEDPASSRDPITADHQPKEAVIEEASLDEVRHKITDINSDSNDMDSRCTTPLMDELPSPLESGGSAAPDEKARNAAAGDNGASNRAKNHVNHLGAIGNIPSNASSFSDAQQKQRQASSADSRFHLPAFLADSGEARRCAECGLDEKIDVVCLECRVALHCRGGRNCFRSWHLTGKTLDDAPRGTSYRLEELPANFH